MKNEQFLSIVGYGSTSMILRLSVPTKYHDHHQIVDFALKVPLSFTTFQDYHTCDSVLSTNPRTKWSIQPSITPGKNKHDVNVFMNEASIHLPLKHPNIVKLYEYKLEHINLEKINESIFVPVLVFEYCQTDMFRLINHKKGRNEFFSDNEIFDFVYQIVEGLHYLHTVELISHRDIKIENLLLTNQNKIKIADFGLSFRYDPESTITETCCSLFNIPPEIIEGIPYVGPEVDCWSLGVVLYCLITFTMPFDNHLDRSPSTINNLILNCQYNQSLLDNHNPLFKTIINQLLVKDLKKRSSIEQIKQLCIQ